MSGYTIPLRDMMVYLLGSQHRATQPPSRGRRAPPPSPAPVDLPLDSIEEVPPKPKFPLEDQQTVPGYYNPQPELPKLPDAPQRLRAWA